MNRFLLISILLISLLFLVSCDSSPDEPDLEDPDPVAATCIDNDNDGYGDGCANGEDCDDTNCSVNPGVSVDYCNGVDNDCDGNPGDYCDPADHASAVCNIDTCVYYCDSGWEDCNGDMSDGCETDIANDSSHCGTCFNPCPDGQHCESGACVPD